ncbi:hypothetical protein SAMN06269301_0788 [Geobacter sp. DSM 9736]|nr:hypothetical protein SAMN06269301_0788 [Geobacter sp. DSM 9736]
MMPIEAAINILRNIKQVCQIIASILTHFSKSPARMPEYKSLCHRNVP